MCESILKILSIFTFFSDVTYETLIRRGFVWNEKKNFYLQLTLNNLNSHENLKKKVRPIESLSFRKVFLLLSSFEKVSYNILF